VTVWCDLQAALADHMRDLENAASGERPYIGPTCDDCGLPYFIQWPDREERPCRCPQPEGEPL
jgi:hypothetical protein